MYISQAGGKNPILYYFAQNNWFSSQDVEPQENNFFLQLKVSRHAVAE